MLYQKPKFQISYRIFYLILLVAGITSDCMSYAGKPHNEAFVYYTVQSNVICGVLALIFLIRACKGLHHKMTILDLSDNFSIEIDKKTKILTSLQCLASVWILITCLIYNTLLGNPFSIDYWTKNLHNPILHLFCPILFILDFLLFSKKNIIKPFVPALCVTYPYIYILYIYIRSLHLKNLFTNAIPDSLVVYPYFFLDFDNLGISGVIRWVFILTIIFVSLGYLLLAIYTKLGKKRASH